MAQIGQQVLACLSFLKDPQIQYLQVNLWDLLNLVILLDLEVRLGQDYQAIQVNQLVRVDLKFLVNQAVLEALDFLDYLEYQ